MVVMTTFSTSRKCTERQKKTRCAWASYGFLYKGDARK